MKPVNKTAGLVISRGEHYEPATKPASFHSSIRPETQSCPQIHDLTGVTFGRFTVIGKDATQPGPSGGQNFGAKGPRWIVRCVCGAFETRRSKPIRKAMRSGVSDDMCHNCQRTAILQKRGKK